MQSTGHGAAHVGVSTRNGPRLVPSAKVHGRRVHAIGRRQRPTTAKITSGKVHLGKTGTTGTSPAKQAADRQVATNLANLAIRQPTDLPNSNPIGRGRDPTRAPKARKKGRSRNKGSSKSRLLRSRTANRDLPHGPRSILPNSCPLPSLLPVLSHRQ